MDSVYTLEICEQSAPYHDQREAALNPNYVYWKPLYSPASAHTSIQEAKRAAEKHYRVGGSRFVDWPWRFAGDVLDTIGMDTLGGRNIYYRISRQGDPEQLKREELIEALREAELARDESPLGSLARWRDEEIIAEYRSELEALANA